MPSTVAPESSSLSRLRTVADALRGRGFGVHLLENRRQVMPLIQEVLLPVLRARTFSYGGSMTLSAAAPDLVPALRKAGLLFPYAEEGLPWPEVQELRRAALLADLYFTSTNALTEQGQLVNLDAIGNRVGALTYGPRTVVVVAGRNKIVPDLPAAFARVRQVAPKNAARLKQATPCAVAGRCVDCRSSARICNMWSIIECSNPVGRIQVLLVDEDLGL